MARDGGEVSWCEGARDVCGCEGVEGEEGEEHARRMREDGSVLPFRERTWSQPYDYNPSVRLMERYRNLPTCFLMALQSGT